MDYLEKLTDSELIKLMNSLGDEVARRIINFLTEHDITEFIFSGDKKDLPIIPIYSYSTFKSKEVAVVSVGYSISNLNPNKKILYINDYDGSYYYGEDHYSEELWDVYAKMKEYYDHRIQ